jgi:hypothetical protein
VPPTDDEPKNQTAQATYNEKLQRGDKRQRNGIGGTRNIEITIFVGFDNPNNRNANAYASPKKYVISKSHFFRSNKIDVPWQAKQKYYYISP